MGQRNKTGRLELVACCIQLVEGGRCLFDARFLEDLWVDPQPVHTVDVHRYGNVLAFVLHGLGDLFGEQCFPIVGLCYDVHLGQQAERGPVLNVGALDLRGRRRVTGHGTGFEHGHGRGAAAPCHRAVLPGVAVFFDQFFQHIHCFGFATGRPPVHDFNVAFGVGCVGIEGENRGERNNKGEAIERIHR